MYVLHDIELKLNLSSIKSVVLTTDFDANIYYDIALLSQKNFLNLLSKKNQIEKIKYRFLIKNKNEEISSDLLFKIQPIEVIDLQFDDQIKLRIEKVIFNEIAISEKNRIRDSIESKRHELEKLNQFLLTQEKEKKTALKIFQEEEMFKKQNERKLLFFLDFINSSYDKNHFLDELFKYIWSELKKIGTFYQIGFVIKFENDQESFLFQYDDKKYYSLKKTKFNFSCDQDHLPIQIANINQRPAGKIHSWTKLTKKVDFCVYIETHHPLQKEEIDYFFTQRIDLISMIVTRWLLGQNEKKLNQKWKDIFQSYIDPIHVINENFEIIQSNYSEKKDQTQKCYQVLALRTSPCENCPSLVANNQLSSSAQTQVLFNNESYEVISTEFNLNQSNYFLNFYENKTEHNLLKSEIIQSEKMSTIGNLANHLAHELNNPLTGLKMTTEFLLHDLSKNTNGNSALMSDLVEISKATTRSEHIIKDLMDFSHDKTNNVQLLDIEKIFKKTLTLLKSIMRNHKLFFDVKPIQLMVHPLYLQQIIFNLIKNSCEAMITAGTIKIYQLTENFDFLEIAIEDSGPGLNQQLVQNIFKPFFTTKKEGEGTGLGLYLCWQLMKKMNGELVYDDSYKLGTRFILRFKK